jgi:nucleoside 2-deoxyribosyltransferase
MLKIYAAGKMSGLSFEDMNNWRVKLKEILTTYAELSGIDIKVINPVDFYNFETPRHQSEIEVEEFDLAHVVSSDIIIVNLDGLNSSIGTIIELHDAKYHNKIPVIAFGNKEMYDELHPWVKNDITRVEETIYDVAAYIKDFYLI